MVFSSITFLYTFLPILLLIYFIVPSKFKNLVLLTFSLIFYFYGEPKYIWILLLSCFINYMGGLLIGKSSDKKKKKTIFILNIVFDILLLFYFKYTNFFIDNINSILGISIKNLNIIMPIGISFFTFQTMSYVIDVYTEKVKYNKSFIDFATYVCLFPQLVAGPIVRYITVDNELKSRKHDIDTFSSGIERFIYGLGKKILLANIFGEVVALLTSVSEMTVLASWLKALFYTLQIYFDFSGYSDMAIGLGLMFGFHFLENFNYPYIAKSITDFWRRWHISLSSWLRDYVYIPLGGNRCSKLKWIRNIFIVWFLTGFWHGAAWNFILWGLFFAVLLLIEKLYLSEFLEKHKIFAHIYTMFFVIISFVIFNNNNMSGVVNDLKNMFFMNNIPLYNKESLYYLSSYFIIFVVGVIAATPLFKNISNKIKKFEWIKIVFLILILILSTAFLIDASFNPFLYFRF